MSDENQVRVDIVSDEASLKAATREARSDLDQLQKSATGADKALHDAAGGADKLKDKLGGAKDAAMDTAAEMTGLSRGAISTAAGLGAVAVGVSAVAVAMFLAYRDGRREVEAMNLAIDRTAGYAGATREQMRALAGEMATNSQLTIDQAKDIATALAASGRIGAEAFGKIGLMAGDFARVMGTDVARVAPDLIKMFEDPAQGAERLNRQMHFLSAAEMDHIEHLQRMGELGQAQAVLADKLGEKMAGIVPPLGTVERAWNSMAGAASRAWDAMMGIGRSDPQSALKGRLDAVNAQIRDAEGSVLMRGLLPGLRQKAAELEAQLLELREIAAGNTYQAEFTQKQNYARGLIQGNSVSAQAAAIDDEIEAIRRYGGASKEAAEAIQKLLDKQTKLLETKAAKSNSGKSLIDVFDNGSFLTRDKDTAKSIRDSFEFENWAQRELLKDTEREAAEAVKLHTHYLKEQLAPLEQHTRKLEEEVATYGMTVSQIEAVNLQRLEEARNIAAENGAFPEHLAYLDQEIELRRRLVAAAGSKEALDANKKATEEMRRDWERMHEQVSQSLTDEIMKGGKDAGELLEDYFRTLVLRPAIQGVVNVGLNAVGSALGINAGGSGSAGGSGGALNLLSNGSSLYSAATGGGLIGGFGLGAASAASELALGASFVGPSASLAGGAIGAGASAGLATGSAGAAGAMSSLAAAAPYAAAALAVASAFGLFDKKKPAPIEWALLNRPEGFDFKGGYGVWNQYSAEGPFGEVTAIGQHLKRNGQSVAGLKSSVADPIVALDKVLAQYLDKDEIGTVSKAVQYKSEVEHGFTPGEVNAVMLQRLNRISNAIGGWADTLFDTTSGNIQKRYQELAQILSIRGDEIAEKLAQDMFNAVGKWQYEQFAQLQAGVQRFNDLFLNDGERLDMYSDSMHKAFEKLNLVMPESRDGFKDMVQGIDTSTKAGFEMYAALIDLAPVMDNYYNALKSERDIKTQLADMENNFSTAVDYTRYQRVAQNYDPTFAADYAYNISLGTIKPGTAANDNIVAELRSMQDAQQARDIPLAIALSEMSKTLRRWNGEGMPPERAA